MEQINLKQASKQLSINILDLHKILVKASIEQGIKIMIPSNNIDDVLIDIELFNMLNDRILYLTNNIKDMEHLRGIKTSKIPDTNKSYVYFLFQDDYLLYIGQTVNLKQRITTHKQDKEFNYIAFEQYDRHDLMLMEAMYINTYASGLNKNVYPMNVIVRMILERLDLF